MPIARPLVRRSPLALALFALIDSLAGTPFFRSSGTSCSRSRERLRRAPRHSDGRSSHIETRHPLDPLDPEEIRAAVDILRKEKPLAAGFRFVTVTLTEPAKEHVLHPRADSVVPREAFMVLLDNTTGIGYEAVVNLTKRSVVRFDALARRASSRRSRSTSFSNAKRQPGNRLRFRLP